MKEDTQCLCLLTLYDRGSLKVFVCPVSLEGLLELYPTMHDGFGGLGLGWDGK